MNSFQTQHDTKVAALAEQYRQQGFSVTAPADMESVPFNLNGYVPDILAKKGEECVLIEVKGRSTPSSISRLRDVAETVKKQAGWRFLFVNTEADSTDDYLAQEPLSWDNIASRATKARRLQEAGESEASILLSWSALEALLRRHAESMDLPLAHASVLALLDYLYSEADLSYEHFEQAKQLLTGRNQLAHGFTLPEAPKQASQLQDLLADLSNEWLPTREAA
jgi:hypothetical protein